MSAVVLAALLLLPVRSSLIAGIAIVAVVAIAAAFAARPVRRTSVIAALDHRYQQACDDAERWLHKWSELLILRTEISHADDEQLLLDEALAAAEDAAAEAVARRNRYATRFISNGFERLDHLAAALPASPPQDTDAQMQQAVATVQHYLDTLWIDDRVAEQARDRLARSMPTQQRGRLLQIAGSVSLLDPDPAAVAYGDLDTHRFRLRAERRLLQEAPLSEADISDELL